MELQDADAPDDAGAPLQLFVRRHVLGLTRRPWLPEEEAPFHCHHPARLRLPESRQLGQLPL